MVFEWYDEESGTTSYIHTAYANSEDGTVDFTLDPAGETAEEDAPVYLYTGQYEDDDSNENSDPDAYVWTFTDYDPAQKPVDDGEVAEPVEQDPLAAAGLPDEAVRQILDHSTNIGGNQDASDQTITNPNELVGTNHGAAGYTVTSGLLATDLPDPVYAEDDSDIDCCRITCQTVGNNAAVSFQAEELESKILASIEDGSTYTLSFDIRMSNPVATGAIILGDLLTFDAFDPDNYLIVEDDPEPEEDEAEEEEAEGDDMVEIDDGSEVDDDEEPPEPGPVDITDEWVHYRASAVVDPAGSSGDELTIPVTLAAGETIDIANLKIEAGDMATPWKPSTGELEKEIRKIEADILIVADAVAQRLTADQVLALELSADKITSGTLSSNRIAANSITVSKLSGTIADSGNTWEIDLDNGTLTLGNISANNITAGTLIGDIFRSSNKTAYGDNNNGVYISAVNGQPRLGIGRSGGNHLTFDGTSLDLVTDWLKFNSADGQVEIGEANSTSKTVVNEYGVEVIDARATTSKARLGAEELVIENATGEYYLLDGDFVGKAKGNSGSSIQSSSTLYGYNQTSPQMLLKTGSSGEFSLAAGEWNGTGFNSWFDVFKLLFQANSTIATRASGTATLNLPLTVADQLTISAKDSTGLVGNPVIGKILFKNDDDNYSGCYIQAVNGDSNGSILLIRPGGALILGGGEYASNRYNAGDITTTQEQTYIGADTTVHIECNAGTIANRYRWTFSNGGLYGPSYSFVSSAEGYKPDTGGAVDGTHSLAVRTDAYTSHVTVYTNTTNRIGIMARGAGTDAGSTSHANDYRLLVRDALIGLSCEAVDGGAGTSWTWYLNPNKVVNKATAPLTITDSAASSGSSTGATIAISPATSSAAGSMSAADKTFVDARKMYYQTNNSAAITLNAGTITRVTLTTTNRIYNGSNWAISSGGVKITNAGRYRISASVYINSASGQTSRSIYVYAGTSTTMTSNTQILEADYEGALGGAISVASKIVDLAANDIVFLGARSNGAASSVPASHIGTYLLIERMS